MSTLDALPEPQTFMFGDLAINYYESSGEGGDIFFIHGNSASGRSFLKQFELLGDDYHLVAIDLPGHGLSAHAGEDDKSVYTLPGYAGVVVALAEKLNMTNGIFVGASLGGHVVLEATAKLPDAAGFVIYGTPPIGFPMAENAFLPSPGMGYVFAPEISQADVEIWVVTEFSPGYAGIPDSLKEDMAAADGQARASLGASLSPDGYADEVEIVANLETPLAILHGEGEQLVNLEYIQSLKIPALWGGEVQVIKNSGHYAQWETPEAFNAVLLKFAADVAKA